MWVWIGGFERSPAYTLYGGIVLLVVLGGNSIISIREAAKLRPNDLEENSEIGGDSSIIGGQNGATSTTPASTSTPKKLFKFQKVMPDEFVVNGSRRNDDVISAAADGAGW